MIYQPIYDTYKNIGSVVVVCLESIRIPLNLNIVLIAKEEINTKNKARLEYLKIFKNRI